GPRPGPTELDRGRAARVREDTVARGVVARRTPDLAGAAGVVVDLARVVGGRHHVARAVLERLEVPLVLVGLVQPEQAQQEVGLSPGIQAVLVVLGVRGEVTGLGGVERLW